MGEPMDTASRPELIDQLKAAQEDQGAARKQLEDTGITIDPSLLAQFDKSSMRVDQTLGESVGEIPLSRAEANPMGEPVDTTVVDPKQKKEQTGVVSATENKAPFIESLSVEEIRKLTEESRGKMRENNAGVIGRILKDQERNGGKYTIGIGNKGDIDGLILPISTFVDKKRIVLTKDGPYTLERAAQPQQEDIDGIISKRCANPDEASPPDEIISLFTDEKGDKNLKLTINGKDRSYRLLPVGYGVVAETIKKNREELGGRREAIGKLEKQEIRTSGSDTLIAEVAKLLPESAPAGTPPAPLISAAY